MHTGMSEPSTASANLTYLGTNAPLCTKHTHPYLAPRQAIQEVGMVECPCRPMGSQRLFAGIG